MKKLLLATAVAALSVSAAHAAPTVYGKAFLTADYYDSDDNSTTQLNSNSSRIGFKGAEALTANTDLVYQLEYGVEIDSDNGGTVKGKSQNQFHSRDTYLGLSNKQYGTFVAGRLTTIDDNINYANQASGGVLGGDDVLASFSAPRANNAMAYFSPTYNGLQFMGMYGLDGDQDANSLSDHEQFGAGVKYEPTNQPFRVGATYITAGDALKAARVSGSYDLNKDVTLGALYQNTDKDTNDNENLITVSGTYKTATPWTAYAQADMVSNVAGESDDDAQRYIIGGKYAFNANTTGHVYGAYLNEDLANDESVDGFGIGTGIEYKF